MIVKVEGGEWGGAQSAYPRDGPLSSILPLDADEFQLRLTIRADLDVPSRISLPSAHTRKREVGLAHPIL
jgi:hypothetical protein